MKNKKIQKVLVGACLVLVLALTIPFTSACGPAEGPQVFILKYGTHGAGTTPYNKAQDWYLTEVEKRTEGRVQFERYWNESLVPATEMIEAINSGVADTGQLTGSYSPGKTPLLTLGTLPALFTDLYSGLLAWYDLYQQVPAMGEELAQYNARFMSICGTTPFMILSTKPVNSLADIKGLSLRTMGDQGKVIQALGGTPINMVGSEVYESIQRGTIDGCVYNPAAALAYGLQDVIKYYYQLPVGGILVVMAINQDVWDSLPADIQQIMEQVATEHAAAFYQIYAIEGDGAGLEAMRAAGVEFTTPTPEEIAQAQELAKGAVWDSWVADMESKGLPGQEALDTLLDLIAKYEATSPYK